jgi:divalent metal cation (Fe/Co/Zn/Cd) transporter
MEFGLFVVCLIIFIALIVIWDMIWKLIACWRSAKNDQVGWFVTCLIISSLGILPIIYLLLFQKEVKNETNYICNQS